MSRDFVCVRPASYESDEEAKRLVELFKGPNGELQNTVFAMLAPDGTTKLTRSGRGPSFAFDDADEMASGLAGIAKDYKPSKQAEERSLPTLPNLRLALNVAACDSLPLVVGVLRHDEKDSEREREKADAALRHQLAQLCFDERSIGRAHYVVIEDDAGLREMKGFDAKADVLVIAPDAYGIEATILTATGSTDKKMVAEAIEAFDSYAPDEKDARAHVRAARRLGIEWETAIPVTDNNARKRGD